MTVNKLLSTVLFYRDHLMKLNLYMAHQNGPPIDHACWMIAQMLQWLQHDYHKEVTSDERQKIVEKCMRWLGFIQGVLYMERLFSITDLRNHSRSDNADGG